MLQSSKDPAIKLFGHQIPFTDQETDKEMEALQQDDDDDDEEEGDSQSQQDKTLKKPDKILACPRCRSMHTKFCYYNNYNVKQPRHFCKACQRYWTAGGTIRTLPIGAGRRKTSASPYLHITKTNATMPIFDGDDCSRASSLIVSNSRQEQRGEDKISSFMQNIGTSAPWPYRTFSSNGVPISFYPPPYWNFPSSGSDSPILGKHSREEGDIDEPKQKTCVLVPKALRIDDPKQAAKSSIWKTLGIRTEPLSGGGMFKAFQPKGDQKKEINHLVETSPALMANPAALSRSLHFHERS